MLVNMKIRSSKFLAAISVLAALPVHSQPGMTGGEWHFFGSDAGSTKYSALDQIDRSNFSELEVQWRWQSIDGRFDLSLVGCPIQEVSVQIPDQRQSCPLDVIRLTWRHVV